MILYLFALLSAVGTALCYLPAGQLSYAWILPLFIAGFVAWNVLYILYLYFSSLLFSMKKPIKKVNPYCHFVTAVTINWLLALFRIRHRTNGAEKLPTEPFVLVANHRSDFDPMVGFDALRHIRLGYISKEGNFRIPIVGRYIYRCGFLPLDRGNPLRAARTMKEAARLLTECGVSVGIYPEGTRAKTDEMLPFKEGAFRVAKKANAPIVIMATRGTERIFRNFPWRRTKVQVDILRVLDKETVATHTTAELAALCRAEIEAHLA